MCLLHSIKNEDEPTGKTDWSDMPGFASKPFTDAEITKALADVFNGKIDPDNLPIDTYNKTGEILTRGAVEGISNEQLLGLGAVPDQLFFDALQDNAFKFAGAKTLDETRKLSDALVDENGNARNWSQFKKAAYSIVDNHRDNWLKAEYNNALSSAQMASKWEDLTNDDDFPYLKYVTAGDGRVRGEHARLNGTTLPKEHTFWSNFYPPNGWNCRCSVIKMSDLLEEYGEKVTPQSKIPRIEQPDEFNINVGTHRVLYSPKHDYFAVGKQYQSVLDALPEPGAKGGAKRVKIKEVVKPKVVKLGALKETATKKEIREYFTKMIDERTDFQMESLTISSKADLPKLTKIINQTERLFKEYKTPTYLNYEAKTKFRFSSTPRTYGVVMTSWKTKSFTERYNVRRKSINFGHLHSTVEEYSRKGLARFNSKVDTKNVELSTATHEFFHVLSTTSDKQNLEFWGDLRKIRTEYNKELIDLRRNKASETTIDAVFIGKYAQTNLDEFGAESFTEYKLSKNPSKYAKQVGELIDKNFKK